MTDLEECTSEWIEGGRETLVTRLHQNMVVGRDERERRGSERLKRLRTSRGRFVNWTGSDVPVQSCRGGENRAERDKEMEKKTSLIELDRSICPHTKMPFVIVTPVIVPKMTHFPICN